MQKKIWNSIMKMEIMCVETRMSTFWLQDGINDNKRGEPSIDSFILSIPRKPPANH
jgi:hypothetical protein